MSFVVGFFFFWRDVHSVNSLALLPVNCIKTDKV